MPSSTRQFKEAIYEQLARIGKSLASGPRLEILDVLCQGPRTGARRRDALRRLLPRQRDGRPCLQRIPRLRRVGEGVLKSSLLAANMVPEKQLGSLGAILHSH